MTTIGSLFGGVKFPYVSPIQFTDIMMDSFVIQTENVIESEIEKFKKNGPEEQVIEICAEEGIYEYIEHYCGLTSQEVMLDEIFTEYFPSLNRRSAFQTIYSTYEVELQALCRRYHKDLGGKKFDRYEGSGIVKVHNFIKHHFPNLKNTAEWKAIDQLRILRNNCVHNDGRAFKSNGKPIKEIESLIQKHSNLFHHDGIKDVDASGNAIRYVSGGERRKGRYVLFEKGSLQYVIGAFEEYVKAIVGEFSKQQKRT
ncbi:hypothetical protein [Shewanella algae]|uniref:hypothetical protein n=2 Tax=Shewanella algae TaxID=38313 RepID=UPI001AAE1724|nr:hypothetical protein [Shewanella algae]MBO2701518.1 hypothetical protein [Shewanella algae]